jgi:hypothetical protein
MFRAVRRDEPRRLRSLEVRGFQNRHELGSRILLAVPGGSKPADGFREIWPLIQFGEPALEIAVREMALDVGRLEVAQVVCQCARIVRAKGKPADRTAIRRTVSTGMKHPILHE